MPNVDDRIVRMEFDNASFEKKINSTLASLGQLDKALKFTGASKGLNDVSAAADKMSFTTISDGIENVSKKFAALSTIAITALSTITAQAVRAGEAIVKSLAIEPILDGYREYETQLNAIQTILANTASKGTTLDQVNDALQKLNVYSDQTIYNFGQMAKNIGTFTAAGVDLDTSVQSIKGIANLAAMSGSNAEQAANAMYQLSQAIATGSLKLIDWNSVVNAGMGGEAFKSALFETGKAMKTLTDVPMSQSFKEWEDSGHSFRESLQDEWVTAKVLTTTLAGFTGDLTEEMLIAQGFSQQVASNIVKTAQIAKSAATEVKTFTQLVGTVKEAIGTGWADTFKIIIGNFTEAKALWTGVNNAIGKFISQNADARNAILQGWKDFGGRTLLIESLKNAFQNIGQVLQQIKEAFANIFPPMTTARLITMTQAFADFVNSMKPSAATLEKIQTLFEGFFSALSIGWEIIKEGSKFIIDLGKQLLGLVAPGTVNFFLKISEGLTKLQAALVKGGGIKDFFANLTNVLQKPLALLEKIRDAISNLFSGFDTSIDVDLGRISDRFDNLKESLGKLADLWQPFENALRRVAEVLNQVWIVIRDWFKELGQKIADSMGKGDFDAVLDLVNVGLLGAITALLAKFFKSGFKFDLGGGLFAKISKTFQELTGVLKAMQMNIKANALLKIAGAIAILTASVLVLSMIDSVALTKALTAMAIGFGQLMAAFSVFTKIAAGPKSAATFTIMSAGLIILSTAMLILSFALRSLAKLNWDEISRGLFALTSLLTIVTVASKPLAASSKGMITAGIGITAMAIAMNILGLAMKIFASMSWEEMAQGLVGVGLALAGVALAMKLMPPGPTLLLQGAALIAISIAMSMLAGAVALFGHMRLETLGKGFLAIAAGLLIIAGAMKLLPIETPIIAAGLVLVGFALIEIAGAMKLMGKMTWSEIARGLAAMAGSLLILAGALKLMESAIPGAIALTISAVALGMLAGVLKVFGSMKFGDIIKALGGIALTLVVLAGASLLLEEAIPIMIGLGVALIALGAGFALVGVGAMLLAKAFETIAKVGKTGLKTIEGLMTAIGKSMPAMAKGMAQGIVEMIRVFTDAAPVIAESLGILLNHIFDTLIVLIPKLMTILDQLITGLLTLLREKGPEFIQTGLFLLMSLLQGIKDNIQQITDTAIDILITFINAIAARINEIIDAGANLIVKFIEGIGTKIQDIITAGADLIIKVIEGIASNEGRIITAGVKAVIKFLEGIGQNVAQFVDAAFQIVTNTLNALADVINRRSGELQAAGANLIGAIINGMTFGIAGKLKGVADDLIGGLKGVVSGAKGFLKVVGDPYSLVFMGIGESMMNGMSMALEADTSVEDSSIGVVERATDVFKSSLTKMTDSLGRMDEFNPTITPVLDLTRVAQDAAKISDYISTTEKLSPSFSYSQARTIAHDQNAQQADSPGRENAPGDVKFEQNIFAPTQLSTSDIYKQTRNQITIAKEELSIK